MDKTCPFGHTCEKCLLYIEMLGQDASGKPSTRKQCAFVANVEMTLEASKQGYQTARALEDFRNRMIEGNESLGRVLMAGIDRRLIE